MGKRFIPPYAALVVATGLFGYLARLHPVFPGDRELAGWVRKLDGDVLQQAMVAVSTMGDWWQAAVVPAVVSVLLVGWRRWRENALVVASMSPMVLNRFMKLLVDRARPNGESDALNSSFPSGHAVHAMAFYGALFYLVTTHVRPLWIRRALQTLLVSWILATGLSRVYLGAHWPSDVLGGYLVGAVALVFMVWAYRSWR